jgi:hypothetical protein
MKIGIIYCAYNCKKFVEESIIPFIEAKEKGIINSICAVSLPFAEYINISDTNDGTTELLLDLYKKDKIDYIFTQPKHIQEHAARDLCLQYLKIMNMDFIWLIDGDEFYSIKNINDIINYIKETSYIWYSINFKNYIFDGKKWIDGFCPPRIFRSNFENYYIHKFYWDNDILYLNNHEHINYKNLPNTSIPKEIAHIKHMTWLHSNSKEKYEYQIKHFGHCGYIWNYEKKEIEINKEFYIKNNIPIPKINQ